MYGSVLADRPPERGEVPNNRHMSEMKRILQTGCIFSACWSNTGRVLSYVSGRKLPNKTGRGGVVALVAREGKGVNPANQNVSCSM